MTERLALAVVTIPRPDLVPVIRERLAREFQCRPSDLNITSVTDRVIYDGPLRRRVAGRERA